MPNTAVLVVDDDSAWTDEVCDFLRSRGFRALGATSGFDGLRLLEEVEPDVLLLDLDMPDITGYDILEQIAMRGIAVRVIVVSALTPAITEAVRSVKLGACDYVEKDLVTDDLVNKINRAVALETTLNVHVAMLPASVASLLSDTERLVSANKSLIEETDRLKEPHRRILRHVVIMAVSVVIAYQFLLFGVLEPGWVVVAVAFLTYFAVLFPVERITHLKARTKRLEAEVKTDSDG